MHQRNAIRHLVVIIVLMGILLLNPFQVINSWAGEKEELQWKARALVAEANLTQCQANLSQCQFREAQKNSPEAQKAIQDFIKELDDKGYMANQDGTIVEKRKPAEIPPKQEIKK